MVKSAVGDDETVKLVVVVCTIPPPDPLMIIEVMPVVAVAVEVSVIKQEPVPPVIVIGEHAEAETPLGRMLVTVGVTFPENPPVAAVVTVIVAVEFWPRRIGEFAEIVKSEGLPKAAACRIIACGPERRVKVTRRDAPAVAAA